MNWKYILGAAVVIMPLIEDILIWGGINMPTIADWIKFIIVIIGLFLIYLAYREDREKKAKENEKKEYRRLKKEILENIPKIVNVSFETMWQSPDRKKITFCFEIDNPTSFKLKPQENSLSLYWGESATPERLIDEEISNPKRSRQTIDDAPPKGTGRICITLPVTVRDLCYRIYRISIYVDFKTRHGATHPKKEDFIINCGNHFLESYFKNKEPISIERISDGDVKWLNSPE